jgi:glycine dehydrogenase subunit 2
MSTNNLPKDNYQYQEYAEIDTGYHAVRWNEPVIYELSRKGTRNKFVPESEEEIQEAVGDVTEKIPEKIRREQPPALPELSEPEIMRHFLRLSQQTFGYDSGVNIGLGTCTMKYSPKVNEQLASMPEISSTPTRRDFPGSA